MKRPELELNDVSEELYKSTFCLVQYFCKYMGQGKKPSKSVTPRPNKKFKKEKKESESCLKVEKYHCLALQHV